MKTDVYELGKQLRKAFWASNMTLQEVAEKCGLSITPVRSCILEYLCGGRTKIKTFLAVCEALDVDPAELIKKAQGGMKR